MLLFLILLLPVAVISNQCVRSSGVSFSVFSHRNQTGHRLVEATARCDVSVNDAISLQVQQWTETCGNNSSVGLTVHTSGGRSNENMNPIAEPLPGYTHLPGFGYYKVLDDKMTWNEGRQACETEGSHMAIVKKQEDIDALYNITSCCAWVGVYRAASSSPWVNVLGQRMGPTDFFGWLSSYPEKNDNNCVILNSSARHGTSNYNCDAKWKVICEHSV